MIVPIHLIKHYATIQLSDEQLFSYVQFNDPRYERKNRRIEVPPTQQDWADYYAAVAGLRALRNYSWTEWGGPDYGTEVPEPSTTYDCEFLETTEEWLARCRKLREAGIK